MDSMSQVGRRGGGFRMEGRDVKNDMAEIKRMLQQLAIPKSIVNLINQIKDSGGNFGIARLKLKRKFIGSGSSVYSKYLFIWKGRIQLQTNISKEDLKQWKILSGFSTINGSNSMTNSFQPRESDVGAYKSSGESLVDSMSQVGRRGGGFRMEGRDVKNDMAEIKRMLQQLAVRIYRIEA
ncbi:hypothetical protein ACLB2K_006946 [Fragaria x ananassa]